MRLLRQDYSLRKIFEIADVEELLVAQCERSKRMFEEVGR